MHDEEHLSKYEDLLEAAIDLDRIPDEYLIAPTYDSGLEVLSEPNFAMPDVLCDECLVTQLQTEACLQHSLHHMLVTLC